MNAEPATEAEIRLSSSRHITGNWWRWGGIVLAVTLIFISLAMPLVQNVQRVVWIRKKGGDVKTEPAEVFRFLPKTLQKALNSGLLGLATGEIKAVSLSGPTVDDEDVARLASCLNPEFLAIESDQLTNDCLQHLHEISNLRGAPHQQCADYRDGLQQLESLSDITILNLQDLNITDAGLIHLNKMLKLQILSLENTKVTDAGLAHLDKIPDLRNLLLSRTAISDAGLNHLKKMKKLKYLGLDGTRVTAEGVKSLKAALPKCHIHWSSAAP